MSAPYYQLTLLPYLGLRQNDPIVHGNIRVWRAEMLDHFVDSPELRDRIRQLLNSYKAPFTGRRPPEPLAGIGIVCIGPADFRPFSPAEHEQVQEFRYALFLAALAENNRLSGANAGHYVSTAENFTVVAQNFQMAGDYLSQLSGTLVQVTNLGLRIGEVEFQTPSYVPRPLQFYHDNEMLNGLWRLRRGHRKLYRKIVDAAAVFIESYYNTPSVDIRARVLLQTTAFEVLLDLPESGQRKAFKDQIEALCCNSKERKYRYKYAVYADHKPESRTLKGIWADRFYTLRNHIIHGERVAPSEYMFRREQHHLMIAPLFFVVAAQKLMTQAVPTLKLFDRIDWGRIDDDHDSAKPRHGFKAERDFAAMIEYRLHAAGLKH